MQTTSAGKTGLPASSSGSGLGHRWIGVDLGVQEDEDRLRAAPGDRTATDFIETAGGYGKSERIVGKVVREHGGDRSTVATSSC